MAGTCCTLLRVGAAEAAADLMAPALFRLLGKRAGWRERERQKTRDEEGEEEEEEEERKNMFA